MCWNRSGQRLIASIMGAIFMKFGRAPTTWMTLIMLFLLDDSQPAAAGVRHRRDDAVLIRFRQTGIERQHDRAILGALAFAETDTFTTRAAARLGPFSAAPRLG